MFMVLTLRLPELIAAPAALAQHASNAQGRSILLQLPILWCAQAMATAATGCTAQGGFELLSKLIVF
jgi:hypothetical protein